MFQPYKVILRPSKKTDPRAVCFIALWDLKCFQKQKLVSLQIVLYECEINIYKFMYFTFI